MRYPSDFPPIWPEYRRDAHAAINSACIELCGRVYTLLRCFDAGENLANQVLARCREMEGWLVLATPASRDHTFAPCVVPFVVAPERHANRAEIQQLNEAIDGLVKATMLLHASSQRQQAMIRLAEAVMWLHDVVEAHD